MAEHPNVSVIRRFYQAFIARDTARLYQLAGENMEFHISGNSPFSGVHKGRDQILKVFHDTGVATDRTLRIELHSVAGDDEHVVGLHKITATRQGKKPLDQHGVLVCHVEGTVISDGWLLWEDLRAADEFWS
jgi:uncharacterized protein